MGQRKKVQLSNGCFGGIKGICRWIRKSYVQGLQGWTSEAGSDWEDGYVPVSLEDFLGIDENNLAMTLLSSQSARLIDVPVGRLRLLAAQSSWSLIRQMAAIAFVPLTCGDFLIRIWTLGALWMQKFHHRDVQTM